MLIIVALNFWSDISNISAISDLGLMLAVSLQNFFIFNKPCDIFCYNQGMMYLVKGYVCIGM